MPGIHHEGAGTHGILVELAEYIVANAGPGMTTLETGCGLSTVAFLHAGVSRHYAIAPIPDEFERLRAFCLAEGIPVDALVAVDAPSQRYLPGADLPELDIVLIDGDHSFPAPFIDWYYTAEKLKVGGLLIVDDLEIVTGRILADFLKADRKWRGELRLRDLRWKEKVDRCASFRKLEHPVHIEAMEPHRLQPYTWGEGVQAVRVVRRRHWRWLLKQRFAKARRRAARRFRQFRKRVTG
jgi:hypothetical protein